MTTKQRLTDDFRECEACAAKPGSPMLCSGCLANRALIECLQAEVVAYAGHVTLEVDLGRMGIRGLASLRQAVAHGPERQRVETVLNLKYRAEHPAWEGTGAEVPPWPR